MEQLLNITWLLAVAAIIAATARHPQGWRRRPDRRFAALVVFVCMAVLLFPVISATDDLHPASDLSDDASWRQGKHAAGALVLVVFSLVLVSLAPVLMCQPVRFVAAGPCASSDPGYPRLDAGRAPPRNF